MTGFLRGLALGFAIAAPVGPIGVLCIRRTLADGRRAGLLSGLGAATADALYGSIAAFGLTALSSLLVGQGAWLRPVGGIVLGYLGVRTILSRPATMAGVASPLTLGRAYLSTLGLTLTNPLTILSFGGAYAALGLGTQDAGLAAAALLVLGVFLGSCLWWVALTTFVASLRTKLNPTALLWVNRISGALLVGFGLAVIAAG